ncbi:MAG TPA: hypothetical protein VIM41_15545 [Gammaproteobacteria bacterium]
MQSESLTLSRYPSKALLLFGVAALGCLHLVCGADTIDQRVQIALSLFPRIVAVDKRFQEKLTADNKARLVFVYERDKSKAVDLAKTVGTTNRNIVNVAVDTVPVQLIDQLAENAQAPTAIFITELLGEDDFKQLLLYGINRGIIVFSPYSGDVERGATVGLAITSRVFPYFNSGTLRASGVEINPMLLEMSKRYE